jgi:acetate kinase
VISQLAPGDVFGVMSLLTGDRIVADVIAGNRCFVLMIPQEVFNTHILTNPKAVGYLSRLLAERTRAMSSTSRSAAPCRRPTTPTPCR